MIRFTRSNSVFWNKCRDEKTLTFGSEVAVLDYIRDESPFRLGLNELKVNDNQIWFEQTLLGKMVVFE